MLPEQGEFVPSIRQFLLAEDGMHLVVAGAAEPGHPGVQLLGGPAFPDARLGVHGPRDEVVPGQFQSVPAAQLAASNTTVGNCC
jgi:hypothetical protein